MPITAILAADIHIRPDVPVARTDDFQAAMWEKWDAILALSRRHECPVLIAGDLGQKPEWPNWLLERFIQATDPYLLPGYESPIFLIPGQHDLPGHNLVLMFKSALGVLDAAGIVNVILDEGEYGGDFYLHPFPYGQKVSECGSCRKRKEKNSIAMAHQLVVDGNEGDWPGQDFAPAQELLKRFPEYDLILTGDNHKPFAVGYEGRWLVNPGSMMRSVADQTSHRPRVYLWDASARMVEPHYLPIRRGVLTREHIEKKDERDKRMDAVIESMKAGVEIKLSFEDNMENHLRENPTEKGTEEKIWSWME